MAGRNPKKANTKNLHKHISSRMEEPWWLWKHSSSSSSSGDGSSSSGGGGRISVGVGAARVVVAVE